MTTQDSKIKIFIQLNRLRCFDKDISRTEYRHKTSMPSFNDMYFLYKKKYDMVLILGIFPVNVQLAMGLFTWPVFSVSI